MKSTVPIRRRNVPPMAAHIVTLLLALSSISATGTAVAAKVYRCGNAFQDQPCPEPKIADARPLERAGLARETASCAPLGKDGAARNECGGKPATDLPRTIDVSAKR